MQPRITRRTTRKASRTLTASQPVSNEERLHTSGRSGRTPGQGHRGAWSLAGEDIMARQRGAAGAGVLLGLLVLAAAGRGDEAAAVKSIKALGGSVLLDVEQPGKPVVGVYLNWTRITDAGLKPLKELNHLRSLELCATQVTDEGIKELKGLKRLQRLDLSGTKITDAGLKELKELKSLQGLDLGYTQVTDAGLKQLKALNNLQNLDLNGTKITDAGLMELTELKTLRSLNL